MSAPTLYKLAMKQAVQHMMVPERFAVKEFRGLPDCILFDFYQEMLDTGHVQHLVGELRQLKVFARLLNVRHRRAELLRLFQALVDHSEEMPPEQGTLPMQLARAYERNAVVPGGRQVIDFGFTIAGFFCEGSWYEGAHHMLQSVDRYIDAWEDLTPELRWPLKLDCNTKLLYVQSNFALFKEAFETIAKAEELMRQLGDRDHIGVSKAYMVHLYATYAHHFTMCSDYEVAYSWGMKSMDTLNDSVPRSTCLYALRIVAKVCVLKRRYAEANFLIQQALMLARELYATDRHPSYADTLMVYGFFLLNYDNIADSVKVYEEALHVRRNVFGKNSIHVGFAYEELAYAHYVNEYSSGGFQLATEYVDEATRILQKLLPENHLSLAYTKRVKGLILEEMAIDMREPIDNERKLQYLRDAEQLHKSALELSVMAFGLNNVQTAKHYGNLGRLYQSLGEYAEAERMQLLAISIKKAILGDWDYEVGVSIGHLASLYNFHMARYEDAEEYYLRSIEIGVNLFGDAYSGLEYDYRGLIKVYTQLLKPHLTQKYIDIMRQWEEKRRWPVSIQRYDELLPIGDIVHRFLHWDEYNTTASSAAAAGRVAVDTVEADVGNTA